MSSHQYITDFMVDIETLDTVESSLVLSIGVAGFNYRDMERGVTKKFYCAIGTRELREEQLLMGRTTSKDTIKWWKEKPKAAQKVFHEATHTSVVSALNDLTAFLTKGTVAKEPGMWGNGPDFDNVIITSLYRAYGSSPPWNFWQNRCYRTMKLIHGHVAGKLPREGIHHNALDDAVYQAKNLMKICNALQKAKIPHHSDSGL